MPPSSAVLREWHFSIPILELVTNRNGDWVAASMGDGSLRLLRANKDVESVTSLDVHKGISLSLQPDTDAHAFLSGGDDGKVFIIDPELAAPTLIAEHANQWIDHVAASTDDRRAYASGSVVYKLNAEGEQEGTLTHPSSIGGLAFSPNGKRLAASHYNGVSLWWMNASESVPAKLMWKGSHLGLLWHPEGKVVITSMQEPSLHGWRLSDGQEMAMQGYSAKIHAMAFTVKGKYLATSGAEQVICWPFFGGGPWGKKPLTLGGNDGRSVTRVAPHPTDEMVAAGTHDGMIFLGPLDGRMEIMIHSPSPEKGAGVTGLVWNSAGDCLFAALENGTVLLFTTESVRKSVSHV